MGTTAEHPGRRISRPSPATTIRPAAASRLEGIDIVRGLVIVIMAIDHTRDFFSNVRFDPTDLSQTSVALFLTRWITHYCAPTFVLLAGVSAGLAGRKRSPAELSRFLLTRGLWLIVLEFTLVHLGWHFNLRYDDLRAQVIWAIGASMVVLAGLVRLPRTAVGVTAFAMIAGHNLLDRLVPADFGALAPLWQVLHVPGPLAGTRIYVLYPLVPWIGVMAAGYLLARFWTEYSGEVRRSTLAMIGVALLAGFVALRFSGLYGDASPWDPGSGRPLLSLLNTTKYPPSLEYLLMTLGPAFLLLALVDRGARAGTRWLLVFGRVPLFFYVLHFYLIHSLVVLIGMAEGYRATQMTEGWRYLPATWGFGLPVVYLVWATVIATLYPLCVWYGKVKARGRGWWWGYL